MKNHLIALVLAFCGLQASAAPNVGVSVHVNQPGVFGRIDIGNVPQPPVLIYPQPVVIAQPRVVVERRPIYLHVPPGHSRDWRRYCGRYNACGQPVYFVRDDWYNNHYRPHHFHPRPGPRIEHRVERRMDRHDHRHDRRDDRRDDRHDRHDDRHDRGHDRGHGHGRGH